VQEHCRGGSWWPRGGGLPSAPRLTAQRAHHSQNLRGSQATPYLFFFITIYTRFTVCFSVIFAHHTAPFSEPAWLQGNVLYVYYHNLYYIYCLFLLDFCTPHRTILRTCVAARPRLICILSQFLLDLHTVCFSVTFSFFVQLNTSRPIFSINVWFRKPL
jgi:hypothetical protein